MLNRGIFYPSGMPVRRGSRNPFLVRGNFPRGARGAASPKFFDHRRGGIVSRIEEELSVLELLRFLTVQSKRK